MAIKKIPYGISDFLRMASGEFYYVDKTRYLEQVEASPSFLFMIRPRRFGKSLWLTMMECYYDVALADRFDELFGAFYIGKHPTPERNKYLILKFNFSQVNPEPDALSASFESHCSICFEEFNTKYARLIGEDYLSEFAKKVNAAERMEYLAYRCQLAGLSVYLFIDEYDNFSNVVLSRHGNERYHALTHDAGFFRYFFNKLKAATTGMGAAVKRMFITGVSPVTLDDVTSGFNIASHISMDKRFNAMLGFTETEVMEMLTYYKREGMFVGEPGDIMPVLRDWYDNYCFSESCCGERLFNSDMVLYCVDYYLAHGELPGRLVDINVRTDYGKLKHLIMLDKHLNGNFSRIKQITEEGEIATRLEVSFPAEELIRSSNFISLLFYFGILTIDRVERGETVLKVPNLTIRQMLFSYIESGYREADVFSLKMDRLNTLMENMAYDGEWRSVFEYFAEELREQTSIRDYIQGEKAVQTLHMVYMNMTSHYIIWPEQELNKGYVDLWMSPNLLNHPGMKFAYAVEFKYLGNKASDEDVVVATERAIEQLRQYASEPKLEELARGTRVKYIAVVYRAWDMVTLEEVILS